ncbi:MAG TPA: iron-containing alcohol dehydrogenase [Bryobacteraceae bacterium]|nr:iron-containing alcohol dehydrogenase [Bryobacteraceae bacterium]
MVLDFATAGQIIFGPGAAARIESIARSLGRRTLLVTGATPRIETTAASTLAVTGEPTVDLVRTGATQAREACCDVVVAVGGGSAIDAGKAIAALLANPGDPLDYLEVVGRGQPLVHRSVPFIAVPTTAGTGSEVTRNAVLASTEHKVKASLRSAHMLPRVALIDPELSIGLPPAVTAATGLDALTQVIEPFVSSRANAMTDMFCLEGMRRVARSLRLVYVQGASLVARTDMAFASLMGGLALANAGLGAVHGFAAPIGGSFDAPHGAVCAALLPHAVDSNIRALRARDPEGEALRRYAEVARTLKSDPLAKSEDAVGWLSALCEDLRIPPLRTYGITEADVPDLVEKAAKASSMKANPIVLTTGELTELLEAAL